MDGSNLIALGHFVEVQKIRDVHKRSTFYRASEMDDPQAIAPDYFFGAPKSEGMHQRPRFYREHEMDDFHRLVGFPFQIGCNTFEKNITFVLKNSK